MTRCQVAQGNQNKMAKLPRTSLSMDYIYTLSVCNEGIHWSINSTEIMGLGLELSFFFF